MTAVEADGVQKGDLVRLTQTIYRNSDLGDLVATAGEQFTVVGRRGRVLTLDGAFKEIEADVTWVQRI